MHKKYFFFDFLSKPQNDRVWKCRLGCVLSISEPYLTIFLVLKRNFDFFQKSGFWPFLGHLYSKLKVEYYTGPREVEVSDIKNPSLGVFKPLKIDAFSYLSRKNPIPTSWEKKTFFFEIFLGWVIASVRVSLLFPL